MVFVARWLVTATSGSSAPRSHRRIAVLSPVALAVTLTRASQCAGCRRVKIGLELEACIAKKYAACRLPFHPMVEWKAESLRAVAASSSRYGWCCELPNPLVTSETQGRYRESVFSHFLVPPHLIDARRTPGLWREMSCPDVSQSAGSHRGITFVFSRGNRRRLGGTSLSHGIWTGRQSSRAVRASAVSPLFRPVTIPRHVLADSIRLARDGFGEGVLDSKPTDS